MIKLGESIEQLVVLNGNTDYGALNGVSLCMSPLLRQKQTVKLVNMANANPKDSKSDTVESLNKNFLEDIKMALIASKSNKKNVDNSNKNSSYNKLSNILPKQYYFGHIFPNSGDEIKRLLDRLQVLEGDATKHEVCTDVDHTLYILILNGDLCAPHGTAEYVNVQLNQIMKFKQVILEGNSGNTQKEMNLMIVADERCRSAMNIEGWFDKLASTATGGEQHESSSSASSSLTLRVSYMWSRELCGPALDPALTFLHYTHPHLGIRNTLSQLCAATLLGFGGHWAIKQSDKAPFVPVDVALHVGLISYIFYGDVTSRNTNEVKGNTINVSIGSPAGHIGGFAWGMLSEYIVDYYGRYVDQIKEAFENISKNTAESQNTNGATLAVPNNFAEFICDRPYVYFSLNYHDLMNFGLSQSDLSGGCVVNTLANRRRHQAKNKLRYTGSSTESSNATSEKTQDGAKNNEKQPSEIDAAEKFSIIAKMFDVSMIRQRKYITLNDYMKPDAAATNSKSVKSTKKKSSKTDIDIRTPLNTPAAAFDIRNYEHLLLKLDAQYAWTPLFQCTALSTVDWEMFVRLVALCSIITLFNTLFPTRNSTFDGNRLSALVELGSHLPPLYRIFHNSLVFEKHLQSPPHPSRSRWALGMIDWLYRTGMGNGGVRNLCEPGLTPARLAAILSQQSIRSVMIDYSQKNGVALSVLEKRAKASLLRIGDTLNHTSIRMIGVLVKSLFENVYSRINLDELAFLRLRRMFQIPRVQVVLIPLHRSYVDFQVMSYLLVAMTLPYPHIVAGEDFLKMGKLAQLMRGSGAFFMRRTFRGDPIYGALFKEYVRQLVLHQQTLEFFIEGTRSRTGKTMSPKLGILKFVTDTFFEEGQKEIDDVLFVPVSMSYDELLEGVLYARELLGVPKPQENVQNMVKAGLALRNNSHGSINIHIGHTISLKQFTQNIDECPLPYQPKQKIPSDATSSSNSIGKGKKPRTPVRLLTRLGWRIANELQRNIIITPSALVASLLECFPRHEGAAGDEAYGVSTISIMELERGLDWLRERIRERKGRMQNELYTQTASQLVATGVARLRKFTEVHNSQLGYKTPIAVSQVGVNISTNQLIHVFIDEAIVGVVAHAFGYFIPTSKQAVERNGVRLVKREVLQNTCYWLQLILAKEFPDYSPYCPYNFDSWLSCTLHRVQRLSPESEAALNAYGKKNNSSYPIGGNTSGGNGSESSNSSSNGSLKDFNAGADIAIPCTSLYHYVTQLLFPHIEAIYVVLLAVEGLFQNFKEKKLLPAKTVVSAAFNSYKQCFKKYEASEESSVPAKPAAGSGAETAANAIRLHYVVGGNKETLQHYFESLLDLKLIQLVRDGSGNIYYALPESSPNVDGNNKTTIRNFFKGESSLERITLMIAQVHALRFCPTKDFKEEKKQFQNIVLEQFASLMDNSKI